ncbi:RNA 2',3'-cyclic phosphodiesterase [Brevibacillus sp. B_LB10_24]|uniref:RNA 2',3'-cyclic phosphodiesterase n=1 Tax=Brevibacillus sp. B_LB10_24 TaxID=3380645 RepID=UPI0038B7B51D
MRLFVALGLPQQAAGYIRQVQSHLQQKISAARWQPLDNLHLTLHFLGETDEQLIPSICADMDLVGSLIRPFTLRIGQLGAFFHKGSPRVLWLGVNGEMQPLLQAHQLLGKRLAQHELLQIDKRAYHPHITLARNPQVPAGALPLEQWNRECLADQPPHWQVQNIRLYHSRLRPQGAEYTVLHTAAFAKKSESGSDDLSINQEC